MKKYNKSSVVVKQIVNCARCGKTHESLSFAKLHKPILEFTHWQSCPQTGEPILMKIIDEQ